MAAKNLLIYDDIKISKYWKLSFP